MLVTNAAELYDPVRRAEEMIAKYGTEVEGKPEYTRSLAEIEKFIRSIFPDNDKIILYATGKDNGKAYIIFTNRKYNEGVLHQFLEHDNKHGKVTYTETKIK